MKIAVTADGTTLSNVVTEEFATCKYLLIVETETLNVMAVENPGDATGVMLTNEVIKQGCEAVITGALTPEAFELLVSACVTRYYGVGYAVKKALALMESYELKLIRNSEGTDKCKGEHH